MLFILSGASGVGKSTVLKKIISKLNIQTIIPYTTRQIRPSEKLDVDYVFCDKNEVQLLSKNFEQGYWDKPLNDGNIYGYLIPTKKYDFKNRNYIIQASSKIALKIKSDYGDSTIIISLLYDTDEEMINRIKSRCQEFGHNLENRISLAFSEIKASSSFDFQFKSDNPEILFRNVKRLLIEKYLSIDNEYFLT